MVYMMYLLPATYAIGCSTLPYLSTYLMYLQTNTRPYIGTVSTLPSALPRLACASSIPPRPAARAAVVLGLSVLSHPRITHHAPTPKRPRPKPKPPNETSQRNQRRDSRKQTRKAHPPKPACLPTLLCTTHSALQTAVD